MHNMRCYFYLVISYISVFYLGFIILHIKKESIKHVHEKRNACTREWAQTHRILCSHKNVNKEILMYVFAVIF